MSFAALFHPSVGEIVLILAIILVLVGAKKLPQMAEGLGRGLEEFRKALRDLAAETARQLRAENPHREPAVPLLMALTFLLGALSFVLVVYEFAK